MSEEQAKTCPRAGSMRSCMLSARMLLAKVQAHVHTHRPLFRSCQRSGKLCRLHNSFLCMHVHAHSHASTHTRIDDANPRALQDRDGSQIYGASGNPSAIRLQIAYSQASSLPLLSDPRPPHPRHAEESYTMSVDVVEARNLALAYEGDAHVVSCVSLVREPTMMQHNHFLVIDHNQGPAANDAELRLMPQITTSKAADTPDPQWTDSCVVRDTHPNIGEIESLHMAGALGTSTKRVPLDGEAVLMLVTVSAPLSLSLCLSLSVFLSVSVRVYMYLCVCVFGHGGGLAQNACFFLHFCRLHYISKLKQGKVHHRRRPCVRVHVRAGARKASHLRCVRCGASDLICASRFDSYCVCMHMDFGIHVTWFFFFACQFRCVCMQCRELCA